MFVYEPHKWRPTSDVVVVISLILCCVCSVALCRSNRRLRGRTLRLFGSVKDQYLNKSHGEFMNGKIREVLPNINYSLMKINGICCDVIDEFDQNGTRMACGSGDDRSVWTEKYFQNIEDELIMCRIMSLLKIHRSQMSPINYHRHTFTTSARTRSVEMFPTVFWFPSKNLNFSVRLIGSVDVLFTIEFVCKVIFQV